MKNLLFSGVALSITCMVLCSQTKAQGGCTFITFAVEQIETCQYRIDYTNANECYPQLRVLISEGSFISWDANAPDGWTATLVSGGEILLTHSSGFIPIGTGAPLTFTLSPGSNPVLSLLWDYTCPPGEGCFAEFQLEGCSVIADGCIEGFVYQECNELPFVEQETLAERTVELVDEFGSILVSELTGADGAYSFCDLPAGTYEVRVTPKDGWTPRVPASGKATITLDPSEFVEQNFGYCPDCACGSFTDMFIRTAQGGFSQSVSCGNASVALSCPAPGESYWVTGLFQCAGDSCAEELRLDWTLTGPISSISISTSADPYFSIPLLASYFSQAGLYTLRLRGHCGTMLCPCVMRFNIDCTDLCSCSSEDVDDFATRVERGFAVLYPENSCTVCFTPLALDDCETVQWSLLSQAASTVGSSVGLRTFCYEFSDPAADEMIMEVTRKKEDGSNCDKQMRTQSVFPCQEIPDCNEGYFSNSSFSEGAIAGGLLSGGASAGWTASSGDPLVTEGIPGSPDAWTIELSGNLDTADILTQLAPVCIEKGMGRVSVDAILDVLKRKNERIAIHLHRGDQFNPEVCSSIECYELGAISLSEVNSDGRIRIQIPFDLRDWDALDDCGGISAVLVKPYIYLSNPFGNNQGQEDTYSYIHVDNFCVNDIVVGVETPNFDHDFRIYPNPNTGEFAIELSAPAKQDMILQIVSLTGQIVFEKQAVAGSVTQGLEAKDLAEGIYFLQIVSDGRAVSVNKFVKQ